MSGEKRVLEIYRQQGSPTHPFRRESSTALHRSELRSLKIAREVLSCGSRGMQRLKSNYSSGSEGPRL